MPYTRDQIMLGILRTAIMRALDGTDEDGSIDENTQDEVDRIAALADDPQALDELLHEVNHQGGSSRRR